MFPDLKMLKLGLECRCPACGDGKIFKPGLTLSLKERCPVCGLDLNKNDSADGPAVFLIFFLGFFIVPLALIVDALFHWPIWLHTLIWSIVILGLTVGSLRPIKAYIIALQYKHRRTDWD